MFKVELAHRQDYVFEASAGNSRLTIDAKGQAVGPLDALLIALGSCIGVYTRKYAESAKLDIKDFRVAVEAELSKEQPLRFSEIKVRLELGQTHLDERRKKAILEFIKNCPVHNTLKGNPVVSVAIS